MRLGSVGLSLVWSFLTYSAVAGQPDARALLSLEPAGLEVRRIELCSLGLKPESNSADFVGRWMYEAIVTTEGSVSKLIRLDDPVNAARFVELADFEACMSRWRFVSPGAYRLLLWGGTMGNHWSVTIVHGTRSMRVRIPRPL